MKTFEMTIKGGKELAYAARRYPQISKPIIQKAMVVVPALLAKHTLKHNPVPYKTGALLQSFRQRTTATTAVWFPTVKYARMVEEGTRPHRIYPRNAQALRWPSGGTGGRYVTSGSGRRRYQRANLQFSFAKYVNHTGTRPQPFMQRILDGSRLDIERLFAQATDKILKEIVRGVQ